MEKGQCRLKRRFAGEKCCVKNLAPSIGSEIWQKIENKYFSYMEMRWNVDLYFRTHFWIYFMNANHPNASKYLMQGAQ